MYKWAHIPNSISLCSECHTNEANDYGKDKVINDKTNNNPTDLVRHEYILNYPCECSYYIGTDYEGIRFCPKHVSIVAGIKKLLKNN